MKSQNEILFIKNLSRRYNSKNNKLIDAMCKKQALSQVAIQIAVYIYNKIAQVLICVLREHTPVGHRYSKDELTVQLTSSVAGTTTRTALVLVRRVLVGKRPYPLADTHLQLHFKD